MKTDPISPAQVRANIPHAIEHPDEPLDTNKHPRQKREQYTPTLPEPKLPSDDYIASLPPHPEPDPGEVAEWLAEHAGSDVEPQVRLEPTEGADTRMVDSSLDQTVSIE